MFVYNGLFMWWRILPVDLYMWGVQWMCAVDGHKLRRPVLMKTMEIQDCTNTFVMAALTTLEICPTSGGHWWTTLW